MCPDYSVNDVTGSDPCVAGGETPGMSPSMILQAPTGRRHSARAGDRLRPFGAQSCVWPSIPGVSPPAKYLGPLGANNRNGTSVISQLELLTKGYPPDSSSCGGASILACPVNANRNVCATLAGFVFAAGVKWIPLIPASGFGFLPPPHLPLVPFGLYLKDETSMRSRR